MEYSFIDRKLKCDSVEVYDFNDFIVEYNFNLALVSELPQKISYISLQNGTFYRSKTITKKLKQLYKNQPFIADTITYGNNNQNRFNNLWESWVNARGYKTGGGSLVDGQWVWYYTIFIWDANIMSFKVILCGLGVNTNSHTLEFIVSCLTTCNIDINAIPTLVMI